LSIYVKHYKYTTYNKLMRVVSYLLTLYSWDTVDPLDSPLWVHWGQTKLIPRSHLLRVKTHIHSHYIQQQHRQTTTHLEPKWTVMRRPIYEWMNCSFTRCSISSIMNEWRIKTLSHLTKENTLLDILCSLRFVLNDRILAIQKRRITPFPSIYIFIYGQT